MINDKNAIPKPMHVQVQELTAALGRAMEQLKDKDQALAFTREELAKTQDVYADMTRNRDYWKMRSNQFELARNKMMGDVLDIRKKIGAFERRFGLEDIPFGQDEMARPWEMAAPGFRAQNLGAQVRPRVRQVNAAIQDGAEQMANMDELRRAQQALGAVVPGGGVPELRRVAYNADIFHRIMNAAPGEAVPVPDGADLNMVWVDEQRDEAIDDNEQAMNRQIDNYRGRYWIRDR